MKSKKNKSILISQGVVIVRCYQNLYCILVYCMPIFARPWRISASARGPNSHCEFAILRICAKRKRIRFASLRTKRSYFAFASLRRNFFVFAFAQCESVRKKFIQINEISPKILRIPSKEPHSKTLWPPVTVCSLFLWLY